ncbi:PsbP-related protein [Clostridium sp. C2-6-12]|uniref:PsbP-related protein n=1 Tax=Clostridium sp. C2-6-12 TaxID=2698832 RepID=UPI0013701E12|nr:PsbP-related protein [Clostridium sp. C2-6-12]
MKKRLLSIILCGVIIGTTLVGCNSSKTKEVAANPNETSQQADKNSSETKQQEEIKPDFETKEYSKNGVKFSYPADWTIDDSKAPVVLLIPSGDNPYNMNINFMLQDAGEKIPSYSKYVEAIKPTIEKKFTNGNVTAEEYKEGKNKGAKFIVEGLMNGQSLKMMQVHIFGDKQVALFTYGGKRGGFDSFTKQANYIISTFKLEK